MFVLGAAAFIGLFAGGLANDRFGARVVHATGLPAIAVALLSLSLSAYFLTPSMALVPVVIAIGVWGVAAWGVFPAQQARLIAITGFLGAPIILSLNASFQYLGFSIGAAIGALPLTYGSVADLGWVGALWAAAALITTLSVQPVANMVATKSSRKREISV